MTNKKMEGIKLLKVKEMRFLGSFLIALLIGQSCTIKTTYLTKNGSQKVLKLEKMWETDTIFTANESVIYDKVSDAIYVSCMGNSDDTIDADGFIAKINFKGEVENLHWITGLNCPKGLAIYGNKLFVIDINELVTIDILTEKILSKVIITGGQHFNDIDVASNGDIFLTENYKSEIVRYRNGKSEKYYASVESKGINGIHVVGDNLLFNTSKGNVYSLSKDLKTNIVADSCFNADGLERYRNGYFCSSWQGKIYYFEEGRNTIKLIDTWADKQYAGDIDVIERRKMLIRPTLMSNKVIGYKIVD
jgi:hypothetical protein